jgi:hypothetical protein
MLKADLSAETTLKISRDSLEVDLIKTEATNSHKIKEMHTAKMLEEPPEQEEKDPVVVNIHQSSVKRSKIIKVGDGYEVVTYEENEAPSVENEDGSKNKDIVVNAPTSSSKKSRIVKVGDGYEVETMGDAD